MIVWQVDSSVKNLWNLTISNPKPDLHSINAYPSFVKIHWYFLLKLSSGNKICFLKKKEAKIVFLIEVPFFFFLDLWEIS